MAESKNQAASGRQHQAKKLAPSKNLRASGQEYQAKSKWLEGGKKRKRRAECQRIGAHDHKQDSEIKRLRVSGRDNQGKW